MRDMSHPEPPDTYGVAFRSVGMMNWRRLTWANDFPHSDSTWPWSQELLAELYRIDLAALV